MLAAKKDGASGEAPTNGRDTNNLSQSRPEVKGDASRLASDLMEIADALATFRPAIAAEYQRLAMAQLREDVRIRASLAWQDEQFARLLALRDRGAA